jgi:hypothetical protein
MKVLVGIAGYKGAGKSLFRTVAASHFPVGSLDVEELVREVATGWGLPLNAANLRQIDTAVRDGMGGHFLLAAESQIRRSFESCDVVLVDALRSWTDYLDLRAFADRVELVGVIGGPVSTKRPVENQSEIDRLLAAAEHTVENRGDRAGFESQVRQVMQRILRLPYPAN